MADKVIQERDLLGIIERLVDNLKETNSANADILHSVNISLTKVSETLPELKTVSSKVAALDTESIIDEVRIISTNLKIAIAIIGIIVTLGMIILGLYQSSMETKIVNNIATKIESSLDDHMKQMEEKAKLIEDAKRR